MNEENQLDDDPRDAELRAGFSELRRLDDGTAPGFDATWYAASKRTRRRGSVVPIAFVGAALAAAAVLLFFIVPEPGVPEPASTPTALMSTAPMDTAPLSFLLEPTSATARAPRWDSVDPFCYQLNQILEDENSGAER